MKGAAIKNIKKTRRRVNFSWLKNTRLYTTNKINNTVAEIRKGIEMARIVSHAL